MQRVSAVYGAGDKDSGLSGNMYQGVFGQRRGNPSELPVPKSDVRPQLTLVSASAWLAAHWLVNLPGVLSAKAA